MLNYDTHLRNATDLRRGSMALRDAILELAAECAPVELTNRFVKEWRCEKCFASGRVHSGAANSMIEAIKTQHRRLRLVAGCAFDQEQVVIRPLTAADITPLPR